MNRVILCSVLFGGLSVFAKISSSMDSDEFVNQNQNECFVSHKLVSCVKYRMAKILWKSATNGLGYFPNEDSRTLTESRRIQIVHLAEPSDMQLFTDLRSLQDDTEITRIIKFLKRTAELFARNHGVQIGVSSESGTRISTDVTPAGEPRTHGEKKKRKWLIILPLIILMKIAHLKMTVVPLLLGIIGLNVLLIGGGGWIIYYLKYKTLCKIHPQLVHTHSHVYDSNPSEYSSFAGSSYPGEHSGAGYYTAHDTASYAGQDWSTSKAYSAYAL